MPDKEITQVRSYTLTRRHKVRVDYEDGSHSWKWEGTPAEYTATCMINVDRIMHTLADKAVRSKRGISRGMHGAIVVRLRENK